MGFDFLCHTHIPVSRSIKPGTRKAPHSSLSEERHVITISNGEKTRMSVGAGRVLPTHDTMTEQKLK